MARAARPGRVGLVPDVAALVGWFGRLVSVGWPRRVWRSGRRPPADVAIVPVCPRGCGDLALVPPRMW
ncbi:MAG: hypothetical protein AVDCRST_MAG16-2347 [uncultured Frankineae bacterium]|uniref:Uncharacterized protein n=1 Tax=uncultured Frankineae bacterium TaxID=437475 RepID=A0A6J4M5R5_9ACTN|nr:MAG: hypothetical protein AVDCRST_MAG16-2347 [uncultured Frankineae bacterium]